MELNKRERLKLLNELNVKLSELENATKRDKLKITLRVNEIVDLLGFGGSKDSGNPPPPVSGGGDNAAQDDDERRRTLGQRQKANNAAVELLKRIQDGEIAENEVTGSMIQTLKGYSGSGGNLVNDDGKKGSIYEYYTPKPIANAIWDILKGYDFNGGKVLDPASGTGIFSQTAPDNVLIDAVELDGTSGAINQLINPKSVVKISPFEAVASRTPDNDYDVVVTNVPFGKLADRGANAALDPKYSDRSLEYYFILRSLDKLKHGGLAAFITPPRCMVSDKAMQADLRYYASLKAEFLGAWRLPNSVFGNAHADTITDIIFFKKHSAENTKKIKELLKENPQALKDANVLWDTFLMGDYFKGEGRRFILGEFVAKDPKKVRDVDRVINGASMADIAKMIVKFPHSRIDWAALDLIPTDPIMYKDGDTISQNGVTYIFKDGELVEQGNIKSDTEMMGLAAQLSMASIAINNKVTFEQADKFYADAMRRSAYDSVEDWLLKTMSAIKRNAADDAEKNTMFNALTTGYAVAEVLDYHAASEPFNYMDEYKLVTDAIKQNIGYVKAINSGLSTDIKETVRLMASFYNAKTGEFSIRWQGKSQSLTDLQIDENSLNNYQRYERLKYGRDVNGFSNFIPINNLKTALGADFDPYTDDDWCISADGSGAIHKDDYYVGSYSEFLAVISKQIENAKTDTVKQKLLRQFGIADSLVPRTDVRKLNYDMRSPFISHEDKLDFLQRYVDPRFVLLVDSDGKQLFSLSKASSKDDNDYIKSRFAKYLNGQTARTGSQEKTKKENPEIEAVRKQRLDKLVSMAENDFGMWAKANNEIMTALDSKANAIDNLHFKSVYNGDALLINGLREDFQGILHGYQNNAVRSYARNFSGLLSFDVGLGKTFTALAATQYVQSIGVKNKTFFILPASVLSNWHKEAKTMYDDEVMEQCLFVGLRIDVEKLDSNGKPTMSYDSGKVDEDLNRILENKHKKVFMTLDSFQKIPLKGETIDDYTAYMMTVDGAFKLSDKQADSVRNDTKASKMTDTGNKSAGVPYFEDMGCDSLIGDEFHVYKNSKETTDFKGGKFLSLPEASLRGLDAQIKAWYIRDMSPHGDGVLGLSATPITNSPLEIYNMISLAVGEKRISDALMGVQGADAFMQAVCDMSTSEEMNIIGELRSVDVFSGLKNLSLVRDLLGSVANIKTADEVNLEVPEKEVVPVSVNLSEETNNRLRSFKQVYAIARRFVDPKKPQPTQQEMQLLEDFSERYGEPIPVIASPFNLISKMTDLIMDDDLVAKFSKWGLVESELAIAEKVAAAFNKLGVTEDRTRLTMLSTVDDIVKTKTKKAKTEDSDDTEVFSVRVKCFVKNNELVLDSVDFKTQQKLLKIAERQKLTLSVAFSPKIAAMIENLKKEEAHPIMGSKSKQLIFCDNMGLHNKLKQAIVQECGIPASEIIIINGVTGKDAADMQDFQDGFNALPDKDGGDYRYRIAICNKKAEVGINLQKGTQATHHLTTGWTPDSIHQRDGRAARQGNKATKVTAYMYNANGTFDEYKLMLVGKKSDWISSVLSKEGGQKVAIGGQISNRDYEDLINSIGDNDAIRKARERIEENERLQIVERAKGKQKLAINIIDSQQKYLKTRLNETAFITDTIAKALGLYETHHKLVKNVEKEGASEGFVARNKSKVAEIAPKLEAITALIKTGVTGKSYSVDDVTSITDWWNAYIKSYEFRKGQSALEYLSNRLSDVTIIVDSDLFIRWQTETALADGMIEQAINDFKSQDKGYDKDTVDKYREGKVVFVNDKPIVSGTIIKDGEGYEVLIIESNNAYTYEQPKVAPNTLTAKIIKIAYNQAELEVYLASTPFVLPTDSSYESELKALAKLQDALIDTGVTKKDKAALFYSDVLPDVSKYTTSKVKVWLNAERHFLPSPYFKYIIGASDVLKEISPVIYNEQQKLLDVRVEVEPKQFIVKDDGLQLLDTSNDERISYSFHAARALIDYVINGDEAVSLYAIAEATNMYASNIGSMMMTRIGSEIQSLLTQTTLEFENESEMFMYFENWINAKYEVFSLDTIMRVSRIDTPQNYIIAACKHFIGQLKALYPEPQQTEEEKSHSKADSVAINGMVSIRDAVGKEVTKDNKDYFKSYSLKYGSKKAFWDGVAKTWIIPLAAYKKLVEDKAFMKDIDVLPPTRYR